MNDWKRVQGENDLRFSPISRVEIKIYTRGLIFFVSCLI